MIILPMEIQKPVVKEVIAAAKAANADFFIQQLPQEAMTPT